MERQKVRLQEQKEKEEKEKQRVIDQNECARQLGLPIRCLGCWAYNCQYKPNLEPSIMAITPILITPPVSTPIIAPITAPSLALQFCSSCTQLYSMAHFGQFSTCDFCRSTNTKALRRKRELSKLEQVYPTLQEVGSDLAYWVDKFGEQEVKLRRRQRFNPKCKEVFISDRRIPLMIKDYLEGSAIQVVERKQAIEQVAE